jgi:subtilisin family serine protease
MTLTPGDDLNETSRQRTRDQIGILQEAHGTAIVVDTDDPADFNFVCSSEHVLVNSGDVGRLQEYFAGRVDDPGDDVFTDVGAPHAAQPREDLFTRYVLPARRGQVPGDKGLLVTLDEMDQDPAVADLARPDHLVHICPRGSQCPATEPAETGLLEPWPPVNTATPDAGDGVVVVVIDGGWYDPTADASLVATALPWSWLGNVSGEPEPHGIRFAQTAALRPYAGHGTFVAGVVRAMAPGCTVQVLSLPVDPNAPGGGVFESDMVTQLDAALTHEPQLINLSAGCPTRQDLPARAFENWWADVSAADPERDLVFVAAAGNNASPWGFWPASFDWAVGVGSLDRDGQVSSFSNWGDSVDVFALGRNIVNAFPNGTYVCHEYPDRGDVRVFDTWLARWSGTSFAAPLVTGRIAAAMTGPPARTARQARDHVLGSLPRLRSLDATTAPVVGAELLAAPQPG